MPESQEQLTQTVADTAKDLRAATIELTQTTTVLRQHISEQRAVNARRETWDREVGSRVGRLEQWSAGIDARLPGRMVDGQEIHDDIEELGERIEKIERKVDGIALQVAKWSGAIAVIVTVGTLLIRYALSS